MKFLTKAELPKFIADTRGNRTLEEFAAWLGVSKQAAWQYERGKSLPGDKVLEKLGLTKGYGTLR